MLNKAAPRKQALCQAIEKPQFEAADRIQKLARYAPEMTALCNFTQPQRMKRLFAIPAKAWTQLDVNWCDEALGEIEALKERKGPESALALACFGLCTKELKAALKGLETVAGKAKEAQESERETESNAVSIEEQIPVDEGSDELLDQETLDAVEALKDEVAALKKSK